MLKKTLVTLVAVILCVAMLVGCSAPATEPSTEASAGASTEASGEASTEASSDAEPAGDFTPAADLEIPAGKTPLSLPVDQAAEEPIKIATIMVQNLSLIHISAAAGTGTWENDFAKHRDNMDIPR